MSEMRFKELLRFCRFDNGVTRAERQMHDKLAAIRDLWEMFRATLCKAYKPGDDLTVDEQLVASRGRCNFRQYIPTKPGKYGIKIFWVCDSKTAYPLNAEVYVGRQPGAAANANNVNDLVCRLVKPWINTGRNVTMDNYFTSEHLARDLLALKTTIVGTVRKNRTFIPQQLLPSRQREEKSSIFCFDGQITLVSYVPKKGKAVILLSSMHHDSDIDANHDNKPDIILHYNESKSGVDNLDHLVRMYSCRRKSNRWPMTLFFNMLDCAAVASYVTWMTKYPQWNQGKHHQRRLFLLELGESLVEQQLQRRLENPQAMQHQVKAAFESLGRSVTRPPPAGLAVARPLSKRQRCFLCPRSKDAKVSTNCSRCRNPCCKDHASLTCDTCLDSVNI